jgi:hypothetical protein
MLTECEHIAMVSGYSRHQLSTCSDDGESNVSFILSDCALRVTDVL